MTGILISDYFLVRHQSLHIPDLYAGTPESAYWYFHGFNWRAFAAWAMGMWPLLHTFSHSSSFSSSSVSIPLFCSSKLPPSPCHKHWDLSFSTYSWLRQPNPPPKRHHRPDQMGSHVWFILFLRLHRRGSHLSALLNCFSCESERRRRGDENKPFGRSGDDILRWERG